jgi:hypothetical protein
MFELLFQCMNHVCTLTLCRGKETAAREEEEAGCGVQGSLSEVQRRATVVCGGSARTVRCPVHAVWYDCFRACACICLVLVVAR